MTSPAIHEVADALRSRAQYGATFADSAEAAIEAVALALYRLPEVYTVADAIAWLRGEPVPSEPLPTVALSTELVGLSVEEERRRIALEAAVNLVAASDEIASTVVRKAIYFESYLAGEQS